MTPPEVAGGYDDRSLDRIIVGRKPPHSQNEKSKPVRSDVDGLPPYDPEASPSSDESHGDMFDDAKELAQHPDSITEGAELGQQKAEAAALAWSWSALVGIYAW